jgi:hypothetical protein
LTSTRLQLMIEWRVPYGNFDRKPSLFLPPLGNDFSPPLWPRRFTPLPPAPRPQRKPAKT